MELVTCTKCGETLLDDTQGCPFCGTPSPKSARRPTAPATPASRNLPEVSEPRSRAAKQSAPPPQPPKRSKKSDRFDLESDEDPEDLLSDPSPAPIPAAPEEQSHKRAKYVFDDKFRDFKDNALPVRVKAGAPSDVEVICPICRTKGFIPKGAVGHPLHCRNEKCPAPVFVHRKGGAPHPVAESPEPDAKSSNRNIWILRGSALGVVVLAGIVWFVFAAMKNRNPEPTQRQFSASTAPVAPVTPPAQTPTDSKTEPDKPAGPNLEQLRKSAYGRLTATFQGAVPNRKATGLRLSATAAIEAGDFAGAQEQLAQFRVVPDLEPYQYESVLPLTLLAWKHLEAERQSAFLEAVVNASAAAKKLPTRGRFAAQSAIHLAALLAVAERRREAVQLVTRQQNKNSIDDVAAILAVVNEEGTFDPSLPHPGLQLGTWERPLPAAVTLLLMNRKQNKTAAAWAADQPDVVAREECTLLWASMVADQTVAANRAADSELSTLPGLDLSPATQTRWYSRLATIYQKHGVAPAAGQMLQLAQREYAKIPAGNPVAHVKTVQDLFKLELPKETASTLAAASAAAELAFAQLRMGQTDAAAKSLDLALDRWRQLAPSMQALTDLEKSILDQGPAAARQKLRQTLSLDDEDSAARELNRFRQKLASLQPAAEVRFRKQEQLLLTALDWGIGEPVWAEVQKRHNATDPNEQEPYLRSALPQLLAAKFQAAGKQQPLQEVETLLGRMRAVLGPTLPVDNRVPLIKKQTAQLVAQGQPLEAGRLLASDPRDDGALELWTLQLACLQAQHGKYEAVLQLLTPLRDPSLREEALRLSAAFATREKHAEEVNTVAGTRGGFPLESAAIYAGLLDGLSRPATSP